MHLADVDDPADRPLGTGHSCPKLPGLWFDPHAASWVFLFWLEEGKAYGIVWLCVRYRGGGVPELNLDRRESFLPGFFLGQLRGKGGDS